MTTQQVEEASTSRYARKSIMPFGKGKNAQTKKNQGKGKKKRNTQQAPKENLPTLSYTWVEHMRSGAEGVYAVKQSPHFGAPVMYRWNDTCWEELNLDKLKVRVGAWLHAHHAHKANTRNVNDCASYAFVRFADLNPLPERTKLHVLPVRNAYLHVNKDATIDVLAPDQTLGLTHCAQVLVPTPVGQKHTPKPVPKNSMFGKFLMRSLPDEGERALVQEQCAMTFLPHSYHKAVWWYGDGRNGKGVMSKLVQKFHARVGAVSLTKLDSDFGIEPIVGASLIVVDEAPKGRWCEEVFKSIVSADPLNINRKNEKAITYYNHAVVLITSNPAPFVRDNSNGVHERLQTVKWSVVIPEEERVEGLEDRIFNEEGDILLDWFLEGLQRIVKRGGLMRDADMPASVKALKKNLRTVNDSVGTWIEDYGVEYDVNTPEPLTKEEVYEAFREWCIEDGRTVLEPNVFWRELASRNAFAGLNTQRITRTIKGQRRYMVFVRINPKVQDDIPRERLAMCEPMATEEEIVF